MDPAIEKYIAGSDHVFDVELLPFDIEGTRAHAKALAKAKIFSKAELKRILSALSALLRECKKGNITITLQDEDCHTVIENYLTKKAGDAGKKIHTGRSRNDQVLTAMRLFMKANLAAIEHSLKKLAGEFISSAEKYKNVPMPGYTHMQQAMLSSVGHYFASYAESLLDDADLTRSIISHLDKNPLGSAAGFGTGILLDRSFTARELGFKDVQVNTLYVQNSRGKFESAYLEALSQIMMSLSRFANDMLFFTTKELNFFTMSDTLTTGSSIMPQKKNLDVLEILRGQASVVSANQQMVKDVTRNLISGYSRDLQLIKKPVIESTEITRASLKAAALVLKGLTPNRAAIKSAITKEIFAADIANELVSKKSMPFRDAYKQALQNVSGIHVDLQKNIAAKKVLGAPGNLGLDVLEKRAKRRSP